MISRPASVFMLMVMLRLLGCRFWKSEPYRPPTLSSSSPGISTLTTWAPISESWRTQVGPERARVRSMTRIWDSGSIEVLHQGPGCVGPGYQRDRAGDDGSSGDYKRPMVPHLERPPPRPSPVRGRGRGGTGS